MTAHRLSYDAPARTWNEALPIGNGHIGAMISGDGRSVLLQLNDETGWSGGPDSELLAPRVESGAARSAVADAREAALSGNFAAADSAVQRLQHRHSQAFLPFADLTIDVTEPAASHAVSGFRRALDLATATHELTAELHGTRVDHTTWASAPHDVIVHEVTLEEAGDIELHLSTKVTVLENRSNAVAGEMVLLVQMPLDVAPPHEGSATPIVFSGLPVRPLQGALVLRLQHDGRAVEATERGGLRIAGATDVVITLTTQTTYGGIGAPLTGDAATAEAVARERLVGAEADGLAQVRARQQADHRALYERVTIEIPTPGQPAADLATRLEAINDGTRAHLEHDPELAALLFHYGRYLLISSSRAGGLPATLQGIWNDSLTPEWSSNYTTNINVQMNYWAAEVAQLSETSDPYFDLIDAVAIKGEATAERLYGLPGWVAHHNTDAWAYTDSIGNGVHRPKSAFWPLAGLWLARQYIDTAGFRAPEEQFDARAFGVLRGAAEFTLGWLVELPDGSLGTAPSTSPENSFRTADGSIADVAVSSTIDIALVRSHLEGLLEFAARLRIVDDPVVEAAAAALPRLTAPTVSETGAVNEWHAGFAQVDPHHRHLSPLFHVYPGTDDVSPADADAARRFLDERGEASTGWSLVWKIALRARLRDRERVDSLLKFLFRDMRTTSGELNGGLYPNFLAAHPPFQIDANLGIVAALAECLLQSHRGEIELLPCVPSAFGSGRVSGLIARPGVEVSVAWSGGAQPEVEWASFAARHPAALGAHRVRVGETTVTIELGAIGHDVRVGPGLVIDPER